MSFVVFLLVLIFSTLFVGSAIQAHKVAEGGKNPLYFIPGSIIRKISVKAYSWACGVVGWGLVIGGGVIYNSISRDPGGPFWATVYFFALIAVLAWFWITNKLLEPKK